MVLAVGRPDLIGIFFHEHFTQVITIPKNTSPIPEANNNALRLTIAELRGVEITYNSPLENPKYCRRPLLFSSQLLYVAKSTGERKFSEKKPMEPTPVSPRNISAEELPKLRDQGNNGSEFLKSKQDYAGLLLYLQITIVSMVFCFRSISSTKLCSPVISVGKQLLSFINHHWMVLGLFLFLSHPSKKDPSLQFSLNRT